jgi:Fe-S-cluster containining protein
VRDGPLLRALKRISRWHHALNLAAHRAWRRSRGERPWLLAGDCRRCAACCEAPAIAVGPLLWSIPPASRLFLAWQRRVNGFELVRRDEEARAFVFRCTHFDRATRSCDSYDSRPGMCRDYPRLLLWEASPEFLPGCGFRARPPNAAGLESALAGLDLSSEQREKLRRGLRLDG